MSVLALSKVYKPFKYPQFVERAVEHDKVHWGEWEANLQDDLRQWKSGEINPAEKHHITQILRLFTQTDVVVGGSYVDTFLPTFKNNEARMMLLSFGQREIIHQRAYALLNDTLGLDEAEYSAFLDVEEMTEKLDFMVGMDPSTPVGIAKSLAQTVANEGLSLFSAFVMLLNYSRFGKMKGMCEIVEWSIRDETQHFEGMAELFRVYLQENPKIVTDEFKAGIYSLFREAVRLEDQIIDLAFEMGEVEGLKSEEVKQYIRFIADRRLTTLGLKPNFEIEKNPLPWVEWLLGDSMKNFFEGVVTDYNASGLTGEWGWDE